MKVLSVLVFYAIVLISNISAVNDEYYTGIDNNSKEMHCPDVKPCYTPLIYNVRYRCVVDEVCAEGYKCCRSDCYVHKVCVVPVDDKGQEIIPPPTTTKSPTISTTQKTQETTTLHTTEAPDGSGDGFTDTEGGDDDYDNLSSHSENENFTTTREASTVTTEKLQTFSITQTQDHQEPSLTTNQIITTKVASTTSQQIEDLTTLSTLPPEIGSGDDDRDDEDGSGDYDSTLTPVAISTGSSSAATEFASVKPNFEETEFSLETTKVESVGYNSTFLNSKTSTAFSSEVSTTISTKLTEIPYMGSGDDDRDDEDDREVDESSSHTSSATTSPVIFLTTVKPPEFEETEFSLETTKVENDGYNSTFLENKTSTAFSSEVSTTISTTPTEIPDMGSGDDDSDDEDDKEVDESSKKTSATTLNVLPSTTAVFTTDIKSEIPTKSEETVSGNFNLTPLGSKLSTTISSLFSEKPAELTTFLTPELGSGDDDWNDDDDDKEIDESDDRFNISSVVVSSPTKFSTIAKSQTPTENIQTESLLVTTKTVSIKNVSSTTISPKTVLSTKPQNLTTSWTSMPEIGSGDDEYDIGINSNRYDTSSQLSSGSTQYTTISQSDTSAESEETDFSLETTINYIHTSSESKLSIRPSETLPLLTTFKLETSNGYQLTSPSTKTEFLTEIESGSGDNGNNDDEDDDFDKTGTSVTPSLDNFTTPDVYFSEVLSTVNQEIVESDKPIVDKSTVEASIVENSTTREDNDKDSKIVSNGIPENQKATLSLSNTKQFVTTTMLTINTDVNTSLPGIFGNTTSQLPDYDKTSDNDQDRGIQLTTVTTLFPKLTTSDYSTTLTHSVAKSSKTYDTTINIKTNERDDEDYDIIEGSGKNPTGMLYTGYDDLNFSKESQSTSNDFTKTKKEADDSYDHQDPDNNETIIATSPRIELTNKITTVTLTPDSFIADKDDHKATVVSTATKFTKPYLSTERGLVSSALIEKTSKIPLLNSSYPKAVFPKDTLDLLQEGSGNGDSEEEDDDNGDDDVLGNFEPQ